MSQVFKDVNGLYQRIKYKNITVYIKNKKGRGAYIIALKGNLFFKYACKE